MLSNQDSLECLARGWGAFPWWEMVANSQILMSAVVFPLYLRLLVLWRAWMLERSDNPRDILEVLSLILAMISRIGVNGLIWGCHTVTCRQILYSGTHYRRGNEKVKLFLQGVFFSLMRISQFLKNLFYQEGEMLPCTFRICRFKSRNDTATC